MATVEPLSPQWWLRRLHRQLSERMRLNEVYRDYYAGAHPVPWLTSEAREEFSRLLVMTKSNYMGLVIDAQVERQEVVGFRVNSPGDEITGDKSADDRLWRVWQDNDLDAHFDTALLEAAITGQAYILVEPPRGDVGVRIWVEHPDQFIIEHTPGTNRREAAAALKLWLDDWTGRTLATLYLPGYVYRFASRTNTGSTSITAVEWLDRDSSSTDVFPGPTRLDYIPAWELPNNPMLLYGGRSEIDDVTAIQDRINKGLADRLITQDFGAFPQKWATGWPDYDEAGNPNSKIPIGQTRIVGTAAIDTKFGQFAAADLAGYIDSKVSDVKDIASRTRTPSQYLLGDAPNIAGDTLRMTESGLVAKVRRRNRSHSVALEQAMRRAREMAGLGQLPKDSVIETLWRNPEFRTEGELVDALVKMSGLGVPREALWERWGATPSEIRRWSAMLEEELRRQAAADPLATLAGRYSDSPATASRLARDDQQLTTAGQPA